MEETVLALRLHNLKESLGSRLTTILNAFTSTIYFAAIAVLAGLVLMLLSIIYGDILFVLAMSGLAFLLVLQTGLSFAFIYRHLQLALLGAFSSLSLAMAIISLIFLFQSWWGSFIMIFLTMPLFLVSLTYLVWFFITGHHRHTTHRKFIYANIVAPYLFVLILALVFSIQTNRRIDKSKKVIATSTILLQPPTKISLV